MSATVVAAAGREASAPTAKPAAPASIPAAGATETPAAGADDGDEPELPKNISEAAARARELIANGEQVELEPGEEIDPDAPVIPENETPEQKQEREEQEAIAAKLRVKIPGARGDDGVDQELEIEVSDEATANSLRTLVKGYTRGEQARALRQQAQQIRDTADEIELGVQLDPVGFVKNVIKTPADVDHLFRSLAVLPGVLERNSQWVGGLLDAPEALTSERTVIEADDIKRRDAVSAQVTQTREIRKNAQQLVDTTYRAIETMAPADWTDDTKGMLYNDIMNDLQVYARKNKLVTIDPRVLSGPKGLVGRRLSLLGVAVRAEAAPSTPGKPAAPGTKPGAPKGPTGEELVRNRTAKRAAASASPGAGSPVAQIPKPPPYDPKLPGTPIEQAVAHAKAGLKALTRRPQ